MNVFVDKNKIMSKGKDLRRALTNKTEQMYAIRQWIDQGGAPMHNIQTMQCKKWSIYINDSGTINLLMTFIDSLQSTLIYLLVFESL